MLHDCRTKDSCFPMVFPIHVPGKLAGNMPSQSRRKAGYSDRQTMCKFDCDFYQSIFKDCALFTSASYGIRISRIKLRNGNTKGITRICLKRPANRQWESLSVTSLLLHRYNIEFMLCNDYDTMEILRSSQRHVRPINVTKKITEFPASIVAM